VAGVDLEQDGAGQGDIGDGQLACLFEALQAGRVHAEGDVGLAALGHQRPAFRSSGGLVLDLRDGRLFTLPLLERRQFDGGRLFQPLDPVRAGSDNFRHGPVRAVGAGGENLRAGMGQHGSQWGEGLRQVDPHFAAVGRNCLDGNRRQRRSRLGPGGLQRICDGDGGHGSSVVEYGVGAQREPPGESVGGDLPTRGQSRLQGPAEVGVDQGFGDLKAGEEPAAGGRVQAVQLELPHDLQRPLRCLAAWGALPGACRHHCHGGTCRTQHPYPAPHHELFLCHRQLTVVRRSA
jgi:hypothetical protein